MKFRALIFAALVTVSACETIPPTMDQVAFESERQDIAATPSVIASDAALTDLLARTDLTPAQRAEGLFLRADKRWTGKYDLPGAIEDFDAFLALAPEDPRVSSVNRDKVFAATEIENAQRRLAWLQNLPDWFADKILMGDLESGAARYKSAGLTPTDLHLYLLREAGFICAGADDPVHIHGPVPDYAIDASWCAVPADS